MPPSTVHICAATDLAFVPGDAEAQPAGGAFGFGEAAQQLGIAFLGLPAFGVDGLVGLPRVVVELRENLDLDLLRLALERGAQLAGAARRGNRRSCARRRAGRGCCRSARADTNQPALRKALSRRVAVPSSSGSFDRITRPRAAGEIARRGALAAPGARSAPVASSVQVKAYQLVRFSRPLPLTLQRQRDGLVPVAGQRDERPRAGVFEQREPFAARERALPGEGQALQIVNRVVIADRRHSNCLPGYACPTRPPRPLDHLAERGRDAAPALVLRGETLSWKDLRTRVARLAGLARRAACRSRARGSRPGPPRAS